MFGLKRVYKLAIFGALILATNSGIASITTISVTKQPILQTKLPFPDNLNQTDTANGVNDVEITTLLANSQMIDLASQQPLTAAQFVEKLAKQDYVILGEYHDNKAQHQLAYWLLDSLYQQRPQGSLLLEMLTIDQQPLVDKATQNPRSNLSQLNKSLNWQSSWDWDLYGKIVQHPIYHNYSLIATNLTKPEISNLMQGTKTIEGNNSTTQEIKSTIKNSILKNHHLDSASDEDMVIINRMVEIQQFRDRRMAEKILLAPAPSLLLTGNFHAQKSVGVPVHLSDLQYQPNQKQGVVVMMVSKADEITANDADFAWIIDND